MSVDVFRRRFGCDNDDDDDDDDLVIDTHVTHTVDLNESVDRYLYGYIYPSVWSRIQGKYYSSEHQH